MSKDRITYVCQQCGASFPRWLGKCTECGAWNSLLEERVQMSAKGKYPPPTGTGAQPLSLIEIPLDDERRILTGLSEFDRVLGGGIIPGAVVLVGGAPGMGKSTLLLQVCGALAQIGKKVLYISGEESAGQIKMRAERLGVAHPNIHLLCETDLEALMGVLHRLRPDIAVLDSIQTIASGAFDALPGNVGQVRYCGQVLTSYAKENRMPFFLIGHVTKEGTLAGPRVLEHLVDCLLFFEGEDLHLYRLLRAVKNRFGSTQEIGIFEMTDRGMREIPNPSEHLIANRDKGASGCCVAVSLEGTRPLLVEVQALVTSSAYGVPQRTATGFDPRRLAMLIAVLEKRLGFRFGNQDVFVNTAGGLRLTEPGADLAVALAMVSSRKDRPLSPDLACFGEVGLAGEIRPVTQTARRVAEAARLGFHALLLPKNGTKGLVVPEGLMVFGVGTLKEALAQIEAFEVA